MTYVASRSRLGQAELGTRSAGCEASEGFARKQRLHVVVAMPHILCRESPAKQASRLLKHALLCVDHPQQIPAMSETAVAIAHSSGSRKDPQCGHTTGRISDGTLYYNAYSSYTVLAGEYRTAHRSRPIRHIRARNLYETDASGSVVRDCYLFGYLPERCRAKVGCSENAGGQCQAVVASRLGTAKVGTAVPHPRLRLQHKHMNASLRCKANPIGQVQF